MTPVAVAEQSRVHGWLRVVVPSFCDVFLVFFIFWTFLSGPQGWQALLNDGDTGFHIRIGELVLKTHSLPAHDPFTFASPNQHWYAFEWLSQAIFGALYGWAGLKGVVLLAGTMLAVTFTIVLRHTIWAGANTLLGLALVFLATGSAALHFHARPHLFTMLLLAGGTWLIARDRMEHTRWIWAVPAILMLWANLHGGFFLFLVLLGLLVLGSGLERRFEDVKRYGSVLALSLVAVTINPYGMQLPIHVFQVLRASWVLTLVDEFKAPDFRSESHLQFMILLFLGLAAAVPLLRKNRVVEVLWIVFLAYCSLMSVRHIAAFAIVCVPIIAAEWTVLLADWKPAEAVLSAFRWRGEGFAHTSVWPVAFVCLLAMGGTGAWPVDFDRKLFPVALTSSLPAGTLDNRLFTSDQWANYLVFKNPQQKSFIDSQHQMYGEKILRDALGMAEGRRDWRTLLDKYRINVVLLDRDATLGSLLDRESGWARIAGDSQAAVWKRVSPI